MLTIEEATEIDEIIEVLRIFRAASTLYAVASLNEQGIKEPSFDLVTKMNPEIRPQNVWQVLRYLTKAGLIETEKLSYRHLAIKLTPRGRKYAAFVSVAHGTGLLRYFLLMKLGTIKKSASIKYATRTLFSVSNVFKKQPDSVQNAGDTTVQGRWGIISSLRIPHSAAYRTVNLLSRDGFINLEKPSIGPRHQKILKLTHNGQMLLSELERAYRAYQKA